MENPRHFFAEWERIRKRARRASRLALCSDFDGTLAPIRRRPESVRLAPDVRALVRSISHRGTLVAIISGRGLSDLRSRVGLRGIWLAGAHGYFVENPAGFRYSLLTEKQSKKMKNLLRTLRTLLRGIPGIQVEPKEATVAIHYRRAGAKAKRAAERAVEKLLASSHGLRLMHGKKVWEFLPASRIDKWTAVRFILRKRSSAAKNSLLFYLGDDITDEAVFRNMKGISLAIGKQRGTAARYFLRSTGEVKLFLRRWPELCR